MINISNFFPENASEWQGSVYRSIQHLNDISDKRNFSYYWNKNTGSPDSVRWLNNENIYCNYDGKGVHCVGFIYWIMVKSLANLGYKKSINSALLKEYLRPFVFVYSSEEDGVASGIEYLNWGVKITDYGEEFPEDLKFGDLAQYFYYDENGTTEGYGHSMMVLGANIENQIVHTLSSQPSTDGIGQQDRNWDYQSKHGKRKWSIARLELEMLEENI